jgi:hypothetical protein
VRGSVRRRGFSLEPIQQTQKSRLVARQTSSYFFSLGFVILNSLNKAGLTSFYKIILISAFVSLYLNRRNLHVAGVGQESYQNDPNTDPPGDRHHRRIKFNTIGIG